MTSKYRDDGARNVVDTHVEPAKGLDAGNYSSRHGIRICDIESHRRYTIPVALGELRELLRMPGRSHHLIPGVKGRLDQRPAKAARRTSDKPSLSHRSSSSALRVRLPCRENQDAPSSRYLTTLSRTPRRVFSSRAPHL